jgi:hypothetical protein
MIVGSLSDYLPFDDLAKILVVCLVVAVIAPSAVSVGVIGLDRRAHAEESHKSSASGVALIVVSVGVLAALIAIGIYALFQD